MFANRHMRQSIRLSVLTVLVFAPAAGGQTATPAQSRNVAQTSPRVTATATRTAEAPRIDGNLDEASWQAATSLENFVQAEPFEGEPATEKTGVRILYDDRYLYVGVTCYDSDPSQIIVSDARRDASMTEMDAFQVIFDTFHDRQNGFIFGTNPAGAVRRADPQRRRDAIDRQSRPDPVDYWRWRRRWWRGAGAPVVAELATP